MRTYFGYVVYLELNVVNLDARLSWGVVFQLLE
jgi:hypothetical protein